MRASLILLALLLTFLLGAIGAYEVGFNAATIGFFLLGLSTVAYAGLTVFEPSRSQGTS